jgi:hypothetical protein
MQYRNYLTKQRINKSVQKQGNKSINIKYIYKQNKYNII